MENKIKKTYKVKFLSHCFIGLVFLLMGIAESLNIFDIITNNNVFYGMAILAIGISMGPFFNYYLLKKNTASMEPIVVAESDERNLAVKNETYARTFSILKWIITYVYFAYTFLFPDEIFVSFGWWSVTLICLSSIIIGVPTYFIVNKNY